MSQQRPERRNQPDEAQGLAELSVRTKTPVDELPLQRSSDIGREDELRTVARKKLLAMAGGSTTEQAESRLHSVAEAGAPVAELSPEQVWFSEFKTRFDALPQLHEGVDWEDVDKSLRADPEAMRKLQALDGKGHNVNIFGEENGEFVFASGWSDCGRIAEDHRNIVFDAKAQKWLAQNRPNEKCNGNATDIAKAMGINLADPKFHEQLRKAVAVNGWAWLKTDATTKKSGSAFCGYVSGLYRYYASARNDSGSFRAALRVKKV